MGAFLPYVLERVKSCVSKKVGAAAIGVSLASAGQSEAGWIAISYAAIQAVLDGWKYWVDNR
jgi:pyruvoyl-dependent arginine decarboxylase (PvlArgDC)